MKNTNAKRLWAKTLQYILEKGEEYTDNDNRTCKEVLNLTLTLENITESDVEALINTMVSSKDWLYPSKEELTSIIFKKEAAPAYEYTYGGRIFNYNEKLNQINEFVIPLLQNDPQSRRAVVTVYNPAEDSNSDNRNIPAMMYIHFRIKNQKLHLTTMIRSNEVLFGWPANIFQISKLHEHVAQKLGVVQGDITIISNSAHLFMEDKETADRILQSL